MSGGKLSFGMIGCGRIARAPIASAEEIARTTPPVLEAARRSDLEKRIVLLGE